MAFTPTASWVSTNSRSNKSIKTSRFPECRVYCLNSTTGQQNSEDPVCLSRADSVMADLRTLSVHDQRSENRGRKAEIKGAESAPTPWEKIPPLAEVIPMHFAVA